MDRQRLEDLTLPLLKEEARSLGLCLAEDITRARCIELILECMGGEATGSTQKAPKRIPSTSEGTSGNIRQAPENPVLDVCVTLLAQLQQQQVLLQQLIAAVGGSRRNINGSRNEQTG
ncbi:hypothetical protein DMN91_007877 [Ooceraea biroi]|nr:hypothetical protein DMN91_007877 [Ooceraea biroi]